MTKTETKELKDNLLKQLNQITDGVSRHGAKSSENAGVIADEAERADKITEAAIEHQLGYLESKLLEKIEYALERMDAGNYGICESCKQGIHIERLKAKPSVSLCIDCQSKKEQKR